METLDLDEIEKTAVSGMRALARMRALAAEIARLGSVLDRHAETMHPWYGPCDGLTDGRCAECERVVAAIRTTPGADVIERATLLRDCDRPTLKLLEQWQVNQVARALQQYGDERARDALIAQVSDAGAIGLARVLVHYWYDGGGMDHPMVEDTARALQQYGDERAREAREAAIEELFNPSDELVNVVALAEFEFEERARASVGIKNIEWGDVSEICRGNWVDRAREGMRALAAKGIPTHEAKGK